MQELQISGRGSIAKDSLAKGFSNETGDLEQIRQYLHHRGFFQLQINTVEPAQLQKPFKLAWLAEMTG